MIVKEIEPLFFTSFIIIAFFCFAFYLIWNQFLKKDTRLSTGLKVLRKKISDLQTLSLTVETQVDRHNSVMDEKIQRMEYLLQKSKEVCQQMEKTIEVALALKSEKTPDIQSQSTKNPLIQPRFKPALSSKEGLKTQPSSSSIKAIHLKMLKEKPVNKPKPLIFGESPFAKLGFVEPQEAKRPNPSINRPPPSSAET